MRFNGEIIVVRCGRSSDCASFIGIREHELGTEWPLRHSWQAIAVSPQDEPYKYDRAWIAEIATITGAPVLACWVSEDRVAHIRGLSDAGGWDAWLNPRYAAFLAVQEILEEIGGELYEEGGRAAIDRYLAERCPEVFARLEAAIPEASRRAAEWAAQAGFEVPVGPIEDLLSAPRESFVQQGFFELLDRLGLRDGDLVPD
jgi:hypothetical protein